jgi:hypothetical protein
MPAAADGPGRIRTCDLGIKSPLLYQLSYRPCSRITPEAFEGAAHGGTMGFPSRKSRLLYQLSYRSHSESSDSWPLFFAGRPHRLAAQVTALSRP